MLRTVLLMLFVYCANASINEPDEIHFKNTDARGVPKGDLMVQRITMPVGHVSGLTWCEVGKKMCWVDKGTTFVACWHYKSGAVYSFNIAEIVGEGLTFITCVKNEHAYLIGTCSNLYKIIVSDDNKKYSISKTLIPPTLDLTSYCFKAAKCDNKGTLYIIAETINVAALNETINVAAPNETINVASPNETINVAAPNETINESTDIIQCKNKQPIEGGGVIIIQCKNKDCRKYHDTDESLSAMAFNYGYTLVYFITNAGKSIIEVPYENEIMNFNQKKEIIYFDIRPDAVFKGIGLDKKGDIMVSTGPVGSLKKYDMKKQTFTITVRLLPGCTDLVMGGYEARNIFVGTKQKGSLCNLGTGSIYGLTGWNSTVAVLDQPVVWP